MKMLISATLARTEFAEVRQYFGRALARALAVLDADMDAGRCEVISSEAWS